MRSGTDEVVVKMVGYIADALADILDQEAWRMKDVGWSELATMLREGGRDSEVMVVRREAT